MKKPIIILLIAFCASFMITLIGMWALADTCDRMTKRVIENAPRFIGWHQSERVYLTKENKIEFKE